MKKIKTIIILLIVLASGACGYGAKELFVTSGFENQYRWTLTSRLGQALEMAETRYGRRDLSWTLLGVEIYDKLYPRTWYLGFDRGQKQIIIQLGSLSTLSEKKALFELSHEIIHVLSPQVGNRSVSVFEEGLATYFSIQYLNAIDMAVNPEENIKDKKYKTAFEQVMKLYTDFEGTDEKIKLLRAGAGSFSAISKDMFMQMFPGIPENEASFLAGRFEQMP